MLEGWAIVDNTTGEDWTKVQLSLVSGRPISFVSQLYAPKYVQRPAAELPDDAAAAPVVHAERTFRWRLALEAALGGGGGGGRGGAGQSAMAKAPPPPMSAPSASIRSKRRARHAGTDGCVPSTIVASASAGELGELFEYRIAQPVTIRKNESAMLPFLQQAIDARKLLIYSDTRLRSIRPMPPS